MRQVSLTIDGKKLTTSEGNTILWAALDNGIYIPNLCAIREAAEPSASCRLCWVEIEGKRDPFPACTESVRDGMVVHTRGKTALRLARTAAELLFSNHPIDCAHCLKSGACQLQKIAKHLGIKLRTRRFRRLERNLPIDESCSTFLYDPNRCVLCGQCVWVCRDKLGIGAIGFSRRGFRRIVSTFGEQPLAQSRCIQCGECAKVCPSAAMVFKAEFGRQT